MAILVEPLPQPLLPDFVTETIVFSPAPNVAILGVAVQNVDVPDGFTALSFATPPLSAGIKNIANQFYRSIGTAPSAGGGVLFTNFTTAWSNLYGSPFTKEGLLLGTKTKIIHNASGYATPWVKSSSLIQL